MNKFIAFILLILLLSLSNSFSQNNFKIEFGGGYVEKTVPGNLLRYSDNGWLTNLTGSIKLSKNFDLTASFIYQKLNFNASKVGIILPAIAGLRYKVEGTHIQVFQSMIGIRAIKSKGFIHPYLSLKGGILFIDESNILVTTWIEGESYTSPYRGQEENNIKGLASAGLGLMFELITNLNLVIESNYSLIISKKTGSLLSFTTSIQYSI